MGRRGILAIAMVLLAACAPSKPLQDDWIVDLDATIRSAESAGLPGLLFGKNVRRTYEGGTMRIDEDRLTLGIEGIKEVVAHNYTALGKQGNCTRLRMAPENRVRRYCVEGDRLRPGHRHRHHLQAQAGTPLSSHVDRRMKKARSVTGPSSQPDSTQPEIASRSWW